jgi:hypothetical protein
VELRVRTLERHEAIACVGPVLIRVIDGAPTTTASIDAIRAGADELLQRWPMVGVWIVAHHGSPLPEPEARRYAGELFGRDGDKLCMVYSLLGLGFWATAAIGVSKLLARLMGQPALIETSVEAGAQRLGMEMIGIDPQQLVMAHDELLRRMQVAEVA